MDTSWQYWMGLLAFHSVAGQHSPSFYLLLGSRLRRHENNIIIITITITSHYDQLQSQASGREQRRHHLHWDGVCVDCLTFFSILFSTSTLNLFLSHHIVRFSSQGARPRFFSISTPGEPTRFRGLPWTSIFRPDPHQRHSVARNGHDRNSQDTELLRFYFASRDQTRQDRRQCDCGLSSPVTHYLASLLLYLILASPRRHPPFHQLLLFGQANKVFDY